MNCLKVSGKFIPVDQLQTSVCDCMLQTGQNSSWTLACDLVCACPTFEHFWNFENKQGEPQQNGCYKGHPKMTAMRCWVQSQNVGSVYTKFLPMVEVALSMFPKTQKQSSETPSWSNEVEKSQGWLLPVGKTCFVKSFANRHQETHC